MGFSWNGLNRIWTIHTDWQESAVPSGKRKCSLGILILGKYERDGGETIEWVLWWMFQEIVVVRNLSNQLSSLVVKVWLTMNNFASLFRTGTYNCILIMYISVQKPAMRCDNYQF